MNINPMTITPDQISAEQNLPIENQEGPNSKQINKVKKVPMQPTPLYVCFLLKSHHPNI